MAIQIDLSGRKALVTGVTDGIGAGIALRLAEAGCDVAGCGLEPADDAAARRFEDGIASHGRRAFYCCCDLSQPDEPAKLTAAAVEVLGGFDVVVSNAGANFFVGVDACTERDWDHCINLNLASHWRLAQACKPHLAGGVNPVYILIGSNHAYSTLAGCFPYNLAKAGMLNLAQSLALEWGPAIRAVCVMPGFIDTPGSERWFNTFADPQQKRREVTAAHPAGRIGTPAEIGGLCAFLASEDARFITGSPILVDGGRSAMMGW